MSVKKIILLVVVGLLSVAAIIDAIRYLQPDAEQKIKIQQSGAFPITDAREIILVYNAWGGIYPGIADFIHKEFFPKSYPCNLCYQTFGTLGMKKEWKEFLDSLPYKKIELHKDSFKRKYQPEDVQLPVILIGDGTAVKILAGAEELNKIKSVQQMKELVKSKIK